MKRQLESRSPRLTPNDKEKEKTNECLNWKVDRVLTNQRLNLIAGTEITSNVPKAWFLALVENRQEGKGNGIPNLIIIKDFFVFKRILSRHYFSLLGCPRMNSCRERKWNTKKHTKIMFESDPILY